MHLTRPVIVIVPSFDGIYHFPTRVSKYILDVYTEVYGLDLHNPEDIIFVSANDEDNFAKNRELSNLSRSVRSKPIQKSVSNNVTNDIHSATKQAYPLSGNGTFLLKAYNHKKTMEAAYQKSVENYMVDCGNCKVSSIAPRADDLMSKQHCLACYSQTFETEEDRLGWLFNWADERPDAANTEK